MVLIIGFMSFYGCRVRRVVLGKVRGSASSFFLPREVDFLIWFLHAPTP